MKTILILALAATAFAQSVTISAPVFSGSGLNDAASGGVFSPLPTNASYVVTISATGTPDHFTWAKDGGTASSAVAITGALQPLADGVKIKFAATTGHTLADSWTITASARGSAYGVNTISRGLGAVMRTSEDKARERLSVLDFGAMGNGTHDDTAAVQSAINQAALDGKTVYFPGGGGDFLLGPLTMKRGAPLDCGANGSRLLMKNNSETMFTFSNVSLTGLSNCFIHGNGKTGTIAIEEDTITSGNNHFRDLVIQNVGTCVTTAGAFFNTFENIRCVTPTVAGFLFGNSTNSLTCINCSVIGTATPIMCLQISQIFNAVFIGGTIEGACNTLAYGVNGLTLSGNYFENTTGTQLDQYVQLGIGLPYLDSGIVMHGNHFSGGAKYAVAIGEADGVEITGNDIGTDLGAFILLNNGNNPHRAMNYGNNTYNIGGAGYDPLKILFYNVDPVTENTLNSNTNQEVINPLLFVTNAIPPAAYHFYEPPDPSIGNGQMAMYWDGVALWAKIRDASGNLTYSEITAISGAQTIGAPGTGGSLKINTPSVNAGLPSSLGISGTYNAGTLNAQQIFDCKGPASGGGYRSNCVWRTYTAASVTGTMTLDEAGYLNVNGGFKVAGVALTGAGSGYSGTKTRTACTTISGGVPTGCTNVTETYVNGLLQ